MGGERWRERDGGRERDGERDGERERWGEREMERERWRERWGEREMEREMGREREREGRVEALAVYRLLSTCTCTMYIPFFVSSLSLSSSWVSETHSNNNSTTQRHKTVSITDINNLIVASLSLSPETPPPSVRQPLQSPLCADEQGAPHRLAAA